MKISSFIDYTLLRADCTEEEVMAICDIAIEHAYAAVCVNPFYVEKVSNRLDESVVKTCSVAGFPLGQDIPGWKVKEVEELIASGAEEVDMVINLSAFKSGRLDVVEQEIRDALDICREKEAILKVILETGLMGNDELKQAVEICNAVLPDFVKTSTGFAGVGAEEAKVRFLRMSLDENIKIKASGGIKTADAAVTFIKAGADRIGTSTMLKDVD